MLIIKLFLAVLALLIKFRVRKEFQRSNQWQRQSFIWNSWRCWGERS